METKTEQHHEHLTEEEKKISAQIRSVAATLYEKNDLDKQSTTKIDYSMGAASAAAKPLRNLSVGGERKSKPAGGVHNCFLVA